MVTTAQKTLALFETRKVQLFLGRSKILHDAALDLRRVPILFIFNKYLKYNINITVYCSIAQSVFETTILYTVIQPILNTQELTFLKLKKLPIYLLDRNKNE